MTKKLEQLTAEQMEELAPRLVKIGKQIEELYNAGLEADTDELASELITESTRLEDWMEDNKVDDSLLWEAVGLITDFWDGETFLSPLLERASIAIERALDVEPK